MKSLKKRAAIVTNKGVACVASTHLILRPTTFLENVCHHIPKGTIFKLKIF